MGLAEREFRITADFQAFKLPESALLLANLFGNEDTSVEGQVSNSDEEVKREETGSYPSSRTAVNPIVED